MATLMTADGDAHADELVLAIGTDDSGTTPRAQKIQNFADQVAEESSHRPARAQGILRMTRHQRTERRTSQGDCRWSRWAFLVANDGDVLTIARGRHPHRPERPSPRTSGDPPRRCRSTRPPEATDDSTHATPADQHHSQPTTPRGVLMPSTKPLVTALTRSTMAALLALGSTWLSGPAEAGASRERCVRVAAACYPTVQAAVDAALDGEVVQIPAGRFAGGVVITKSITIAGAGSSSTQLAGGEHVLTVGTWMAITEPTVRISGLTLRGGHAHSSPESIDQTGKPGVFAAEEASRSPRATTRAPRSRCRTV